MANPTIQQIQLGNTTYDIRPASAYQDTDTKVKSNNLTSGERPLLLSSATTPTTAAGEVYQNANLKYNAGTGVFSVPEVTGAYINSHPENGPCLIPFIYNDIAFLERQGGSVSMYKVASTADMTLLTLPNQTAYKPSNYANMFDASPSYVNFSGFTKDDTDTSYIIDISLPRVFSYSNVVYIDFGSSSWRAQNITILVSHTNMTNYVQKASITGLAVGNYKASMSHSFTASGATTVTQGFNKIRFVLTKFANTSPRIAQIGIINYSSNGTRYTTMSRGIDDAVWRNITPDATKTYSLGSSSKLWNGVYGNTLYAGASIMPTTNSAVTMGSSSVLFKDAYSYQAHINTAVTTQVQVGTGNIIATTTANRATTKYWATDGTIQSVPTVPTPKALTIQFNGVKKVDYTDAAAATVNIPTLDTVTATVATAASSATAAVKVSTTVSTAGAKTATFAFTLPQAPSGTPGAAGRGVSSVSTVATSTAAGGANTYQLVYTDGTKSGNLTVYNGKNGNNNAALIGSVSALGTDLNNYKGETAVGFWYIGGSATVSNRPSGVDAFYMEVNRAASGWYYQLLIPSNAQTNTIWMREWNSSSWTSWVEKGKTGATGVGVGTVTATVTTAASSASPTVTVSQVTSSNNKNCTFAFTLPKGANGANGSGVGTVTATVASVASNVAPTVTVTTAASGTDKNVTMAFKLPKGDTGATGVVSVVTAGSGNAVTSGSYDSSTKTITFTKGSSFLASNGTAVCASKLGTATVGSTLQPIFLNGGTPTTCSGFMRNGNGLNILGGHVAIIDTNNEPLLLMSNTTANTTAHINYNQPDGYKAYAAYILHAGSSTSYADLTAGNITAMTKMSAPAFYETSDARKKDIIGEIDLDKCISLMDYCNQVVYKLKGDDKEQIGMIAQEVEQWFPEIVTTDEDGYKSLDYSRLTVICLKLIKDLYDKFSSLNSYINECE